MASETAARELFAEYEQEAQRGERASPLAFLGLGPSVAVKDRLAYALGRGGKEVNEHILKAKVAAVSEELTRLIFSLKGEFARLRTQESDLLAQVAYVVAIFFGLAVLVAALLVDYRIIHEFWTRAVMDELGKVPATLKTSVYFKSGQVIFATLAFHFMLETVGETGRRIFVMFIFLLTVVMLMGIGLIVANNWLPAGSQLFGVDLHAAAQSGQDILAGLGLPSANKASPVDPAFAANVKTVQTLIWLGSLSMIFIIVTGVGSLSLRNAVHNFQKLAGAETNDFASPGAMGLRGSRKERMEQLKVRADRFGVILDPPARKGAQSGVGDASSEYNGNRNREIAERTRIVRKSLLDFANSYAAGLHDYQTGIFGLQKAAREAKARALLSEFGATLEALMADYVDRYVEAHTLAGPYIENPAQSRPPKRSRPWAVPNDNDERFGT